MKKKYVSPRMNITYIHLEESIAAGSANDFHYFIESEDINGVKNLEFFDYSENSKGENDLYL